MLIQFNKRFPQFTNLLTETLMTNSNPYVQQILEQGKEPSRNPAPKRQFPTTIFGRTFNTEEEYQEALHEFLNGN